jgi:hypothetical protein
MKAAVRRRWSGLAAACLLAAAPASAQQMPVVEFEDPDMPARTREYLQRWSGTVRAWAMVQRVVEQVREQNEDPPAAERVREIDEAWKAGRDPNNLPQKLAANDCARALQAVVAGNTTVAEIAVADARGALVCATARTDDYDQSDEESFRRAFAEGRGAVFVSRVTEDADAGGEVVRISVPVMDGGRAIGVLTVSRLVFGI